MRTLFLEPSGPITGDMIAGLLCDLGVQPSAFEWELSKVDLGAFHLHFERRRQGEADGVHFGIHAGAVHTHDQDADAGEFHAEHVHQHANEEEEHEHHAHGGDCQSSAELRARLAASDLPEAIKERVLAVFDRFVSLEADAKQADAESLAFDGAGALAAGAQMVCACAGLAELGIEQIHAAAPATEPIAAAILAAYPAAGGAASPQGKRGCGIGRDGSLQGTLDADA